MARIRTIKPEFFTSEDIVELTPLTRLFYISLWCEADREGRLSWKPKTLKLRYFPGDDCNIESMANELIEAGLIVIYEVEKALFAEIPGFKRHQNINNRESESTIPPKKTPEKPSKAQGNDASYTRESGVKAEGKGREGKGKERKGKEGVLRPTGRMSTQGADTAPKEKIPYKKITDIYHDRLPELRRVVDLNKTRQSHIRQRWQNGLPTIDAWERYFEKVRNSKFLMGRTEPRKGAKVFQADFDWLIRPSNVSKVIEGKYDG